MAAIDMPLNPTTNQVFEAQNGVAYIYDGEKWNASASNSGGGGGSAQVSVGTNPPTDPAPKIGDLWYNSNDGVLYVWYVDQSQVDDAGEGQWVDCRPGNEGTA